VEVDLSQVESLYRELAARVTVEETENERQDTEIEGVTTDLTALNDIVAVFSNDFSAANIRTDNITAVGFDTDISVGASLLPTTAALVGPIHSLGSETHEWKTVFAEDVKLDGTSLATTLGGLRGDIDAIEGLTMDLTELTNTVAAFSNDFSAANIRTDSITTIGFDTDISVGASLLPTTAALVGPIHSLDNETHEWKTVFAEDVTGWYELEHLGGIEGGYRRHRGSKSCTAPEGGWNRVDRRRPQQTRLRSVGLSVVDHLHHRHHRE
jgi:hypothetical protein